MAQKWLWHYLNKPAHSVIWEINKTFSVCREFEAWRLSKVLGFFRVFDLYGFSEQLNASKAKGTLIPLNQYHVGLYWCTAAIFAALAGMQDTDPRGRGTGHRPLTLLKSISWQQEGGKLATSNHQVPDHLTHIFQNLLAICSLLLLSGVNLWEHRSCWLHGSSKMWNKRNLTWVTFVLVWRALNFPSSLCVIVNIHTSYTSMHLQATHRI